MRGHEACVDVVCFVAITLHPFVVAVLVVLQLVAILLPELVDWQDTQKLVTVDAEQDDFFDELTDEGRGADDGPGSGLGWPGGATTGGIGKGGGLITGGIGIGTTIGIGMRMPLERITESACLHQTPKRSIFYLPCPCAGTSNSRALSRWRRRTDSGWSCL